MAGSAFPIRFRGEWDDNGALRGLENDVAQVGQRAKRQFESDFGQINQIITRALSLPRGANGALDIDSSSMRRAADDAQAFAIAARETSNAASRLARETNDTSQATRLFVAASRAAAVEAEAEAQKLNAAALAAERLQAEMAKTASSTNRVVQATGRGTDAFGINAQSLRGNRFAMIQVGQQLQDMTVGFASGQRGAIVMAQQLPQLAFALSDVGGKVGTVARTLAGPWGFAVFGAITAIGLFSESMFGAKESNNGLTDSLDITKNSYQQLQRVVEEYNRSQEKTNELTLASAEANRDQARSLLAAARAELIRLQQLAERQATDPSYASEVGNIGVAVTGYRAMRTESRIAGLTSDLREAERTVAELSAAGRIDAATNATNEYERAVRNLRLEQRRGNLTEEEYGRRYEQLTRRRNEQLESIRERSRRTPTRTRRGPGEPSAPSTDEAAGLRILSAAQGYVGLNENRDRSPLRALFQQANINVDPRITAWCAAFVNAVLATEGLPGTGSLSARSFMNYGQATNRPERGDIVVLRRGRGTESGHVGFYEGTNRDGSVRVLGGNQGRNGAVSVANFAARDVLGYRRAPNGDDAARITRQAEALQRTIDQSVQSAEQLRGQFDVAPKDIDRATAATSQLNNLIEEAQARLAAGGLGAEQVAALNRAVASAQTTRDQLIPQFLRAPITDRLRDAEREQSIQGLRLSGLDQEADALALQYEIMQRMGVENTEQLAVELNRRGISAEQYRQLFSNLEVMRQMTEEAARQDELGISVAARMRQVQGIRSTITDSLFQAFNGGDNIIGGLFDGLRKQVNELLSRNIVQSVFGDMFNDIEQMLANDPRVEADRRAAVVTDDVTTRMEELSASADRASAALSNIAAPANDNDGLSKLLSGKGRSKQAAIAAETGDLVVAGRPSVLGRATGEGALSNDPLYVMQVTFGRLFERFLGLDAPLAEALGRSVTSGLRGAAFGSAANALLLGGRGSKTGSAIGGALGNILGDNVGKVFGKGVAKALGSFAGPLGSIAGGLIGGIAGKLLSGTKTGVANIGGSGSNLTISSYTGNSKSLQANAGKGGDSVIATIERIAEQLGASVNAGAGSVSIGLRDDKYRVDPTGKGNTKKKKGAVDFGEDAEAAVRYATLDLIKDGVIAGLRASQQRLLQAAKDIDSGLQKALDFGSVFTRLKQYKDPVGAALDALDSEFSRLRKIFDEAAATTEEYAALEELYGIERAKAIKEASQRVTASLRSLLDDLTVGNDAYSVSTRLMFAKAKYDPLAQRVAGGDITAYDDFAAAARELLDLQRQYSGSTMDYFKLLDEVTALTRSRVEAEDNIASISSGRDSLFPKDTSEAIASNAAAVTGAINEQTQQLLEGFGNMFAGFMANVSNSNGGTSRAGFPENGYIVQMV